MKKSIAALALGTALVLGLGACSTATTQTANTENADVSAQVDAALAELSGQVLSVGPNGETPAGFDATTLTDDEVAKVKAGNFKVAIVMHYAGNDWSTAQVQGLESEFTRLGMEVVAVTDANFKPEQQVSDLETVLALKPDLIVSIPTDPVATAAAYAQARDAGVKLVFMDNVPDGFVGGKDYVSVVSADNKGNGVVSAHLLAKALGGQGEIGLVFHDAEFFVTAQRYEGFKETIALYPDITIVEEKGIGGPDFAGDAQAATTALLTKYPNLAGIWGVWDVPAEGIMAAARESGRPDLKIATEDLGTNVAIALAKDELIVGLGAQRPYDQGVAEARLGAASLIGKTDIPNFVALGALPVTHENVLDSWKTVYQVEAPESISSVYKK
ncbi:sugar ABC transporter substrate-binding protein [Cryobacterium roopkundense]|uniref:Ribose transport system substrate-binding protein n=1 Tax=Cryobacterium roopkundense TaxID=1001240 RepID=A0A099J4Y6_9MICO|nr:substrate-binding domain-containing protein [Cryobacterium roopkundense]KGJ73401.1 sugar ABC transporter substrate-binding protein [Cryobacterium roopkundense]MBB5640483.1 ribose transport system substrate-binding protein [Cryobacterium roopkundense]